MHQIRRATLIILVTLVVGVLGSKNAKSVLGPTQAPYIRPTTITTTTTTTTTTPTTITTTTTTATGEIEHISYSLEELCSHLQIPDANCSCEATSFLCEVGPQIFSGGFFHIIMSSKKVKFLVSSEG